MTFTTLNVKDMYTKLNIVYCVKRRNFVPDYSKYTIFVTPNDRMKNKQTDGRIDAKIELIYNTQMSEVLLKFIEFNIKKVF